MRTEEQNIANMIEILQSKMIKDYKAGTTRRDAHPKCLGLLKANFNIVDSIPNEFKKGVFSSANSFKAWVRISNASGNVQSDKIKDFRGFAIKLLGVKGERFTLEETNTQDFLLMSNPTMPLGTVKLFRDAVYYSIKWHPLVFVMKLLLSGKNSILKVLKNGKKNDSSPLDIGYWSTTPYQLENEKVKYKIVPTSTFSSQLPDIPTDDYLTKNMEKHLKDHKATFDFYVQKYVDEFVTPIEDASIEWKEEDSPFVKVAEIEIPMQEFNVKTRFDLAEILSFSPANSLKVQQPIGGINRARIVIYRVLSDFRHKMNSKSLIEPRLEEYDQIK